MSFDRSRIALVAAALLLALVLAGSAGPAAAASAGGRAQAFDLGGGATLVIRRGSVPSGARIVASRSGRRARRLGSGARGFGRPVRLKVRGGRLRKRAKVVFRVPGRRSLRVAGSPRYGVARYRPRLKRWVPIPTHLNSKRRTATASFLGSGTLSLVVSNAVRATADTISRWILRGTGLRGPAADCSRRGSPPAWADLSTSNADDDALRSCGGSEGDAAVVEMVNNRPYGIILDYGAPVGWGWADGGFGLSQAIFDDGPLADLIGGDGLYVPPTRRASVGIPRGGWSEATFTAQRTLPTLAFDLIEWVLGNGVTYRALDAIQGDCASDLAAAIFGVHGSPRDAAELSVALQSVLPAVLACAPEVADVLGVSSGRAQVLKAARRFLTPLLIGRIVATLVDHTGFFDGSKSFTIRARSSSTPQDPAPSTSPSTPASSDPAPEAPSGTSPSPSPSKSVSLAKGASAQGLSGCSSSYCRYMVVKFKNFSGGSHTIKCRENGVSFYTYTRSGTSNTSAVCYYGFLGQTVWVTVDGTASNHIVW